MSFVLLPVYQLFSLLSTVLLDNVFRSFLRFTFALLPYCIKLLSRLSTLGLNLVWITLNRVPVPVIQVGCLSSPLGRVLKEHC